MPVRAPDEVNCRNCDIIVGRNESPFLQPVARCLDVVRLRKPWWARWGVHGLRLRPIGSIQDQTARADQSCGSPDYKFSDRW